MKKFSSLLMEIHNMLDKDKLHNFISEIQSLAQNALRKQKVQDLPSAIDAADTLINFWSNNVATDLTHSSKSKKKEKVKGWKKDEQKSNENEKDKGKMDTASSSQGKQGGKKVCWTCYKPRHQERNYPRQWKINAHLAKDEKKASRKGQEIIAYANLLHLINTLSSVGKMDIDEGKSKTEVAYVSVADSVGLSDAYRTLMYVDMKIGEKNIIAMVDSSATHTLVALKVVREYKLKVTNFPTKMKVLILHTSSFSFSTDSSFCYFALSKFSIINDESKY